MGKKKGKAPGSAPRSNNTSISESGPAATNEGAAPAAVVVKATPVVPAASTPVVPVVAPPTKIAEQKPNVPTPKAQVPATAPLNMPPIGTTAATQFPSLIAAPVGPVHVAGSPIKSSPLGKPESMVSNVHKNVVPMLPTPDKVEKIVTQAAKAIDIPAVPISAGNKGKEKQEKSQPKGSPKPSPKQEKSLPIGIEPKLSAGAPEMKPFSQSPNSKDNKKCMKQNVDRLLENTVSAVKEIPQVTAAAVKSIGDDLSLFSKPQTTFDTKPAFSSAPFAPTKNIDFKIQSVETKSSPVIPAAPKVESIFPQSFMPDFKSTVQTSVGNVSQATAKQAPLPFESIFAKNIASISENLTKAPEQNQHLFDIKDTFKVTQPAPASPKVEKKQNKPAGSPKTEQKSGNKPFVDKGFDPIFTPDKKPSGFDQTPFKAAVLKEVSPANIKSVFEEVKKTEPIPIKEKSSEQSKSVAPNLSQSPQGGSNKKEDFMKDFKSSSPKPEIPKKPTGLKPAKAPKEVGQKPKTDDDDKQKSPNIPVTANIQSPIPKPNAEPMKPAFTSPKVETLPLDIKNNKTKPVASTPPSSPMKPVSLFSDTIKMPLDLQSPALVQSLKASAGLPNVEIDLKADSPKAVQKDIPKKQDEVPKKSEAKKDESNPKGKEQQQKKGKNAPKNVTADDFLKDNKVPEKEATQSKKQDEVKVEKKDSEKTDKTEKLSTKSEKPTAGKVEKSEQQPSKIEEIPSLTSKITTDVPATDKKQQKDKNDKPDNKKKGGKDVAKSDDKNSTEDGSSAVKVDSKETKTPVKQNQDKNSKDSTPQKDTKKDQSSPKDIKIVKDEKDSKSNQQPKEAPKAETTPITVGKTSKDDKEAKKPKGSELGQPKDTKAPKKKEQEDKTKAEDKQKDISSGVDKGKKEDVKVTRLSESEKSVKNDSDNTKGEKKNQTKTQQQQKKSSNEDEVKPQGKEQKDKKTPEKGGQKNKPNKPENAPNNDQSKSTQSDNVDKKKPEVVSQQPPKPKGDKPKEEKKDSQSDSKSKPVVEKKKETKISVSEDKDDDRDTMSPDGSTTESTAAKKKRRRKKKNKKPAEEGVADITQDKPKQTEAKDQKPPKKPTQQASNTPKGNQQGTKSDKPSQPKSGVISLPPPPPPTADAKISLPQADQKPIVNDSSNQGTESENKKKNKKKKKQGGESSGELAAPGGENDPAGQKKNSV